MTVAEHLYYESFLGIWLEVAKRLIPDIKKSEKNLLAICNTDIPRRCFLRAYVMFPKIETLNEEEKKELKKMVIDNFPGRSKEWLVDSCKVIYTAGCMM